MSDVRFQLDSNKAPDDLLSISFALARGGRRRVTKTQAENGIVVDSADAPQVRHLDLFTEVEAFVETSKDTKEKSA
jgi:hypothetical protein